MPRSGAEASARLERAALELFRTQGWEQTTTAEIAARAGVTERTFFRHFADKREVLFHVETALQERLAAAFTDVPAGLSPWAAMRRAFRAMAPFLETHRDLAVARHAVVAATPALRERELAKAAALAEVVTTALRARGLSEARAVLCAQVGTAALGVAVRTWTTTPGSDYAALVSRTFADVRHLSAAPLRR